MGDKKFVTQFFAKCDVNEISSPPLLLRDSDAKLTMKLVSQSIPKDDKHLIMGGKIVLTNIVFVVLYTENLSSY